MIMLRSIAALVRNYIGRPSSEKIRACSDILSDALSGKSHLSLQLSFAGKFGCTQEVGRNTRLRLVFLPTLLSCSSRFLRAL